MPHDDDSEHLTLYPDRRLPIALVLLAVASIAAGAVLVPSREIVARLHAAGLRRRKVSRLAR